MGLNRILIVDDELGGFMAGLLKNRGYAVVFYTNGATALDEINRGIEYDVAIVDRGLPEVSGEVIVKRLREMHPNTPVIRTSGTPEFGKYEDKTDPEFLQKPFEADELLARIKRLTATPASLAC